MDYILKNYYLGFFRYLPFWEATRIGLDPTKYYSVHFFKRNLLPSSNTCSGCPVRDSKRKALKCPGSRTLGLIREILKLQRFPTALAPQRYLFPARHLILEQDGRRINWVLKAFCRYFQKKNIWMQCIFVIFIVTLNLRLCFHHFCWWKFLGKKAIFVWSWKNKGYLSPLWMVWFIQWNLFLMFPRYFNKSV